MAWPKSHRWLPSTITLTEVPANRAGWGRSMLWDGGGVGTATDLIGSYGRWSRITAVTYPQRRGDARHDRRRTGCSGLTSTLPAPTPRAHSVSQALRCGASLGA